jgi:hypothetical protein
VACGKNQRVILYRSILADKTLVEECFQNSNRLNTENGCG